MEIYGNFGEVDGLKFIIENKEDIIESYPAHGRYYEEDMVRYILDNYKGGIFIDVGSCIGTHSLPFSKIADFVYSFEPNMDMFIRQVTNIAINTIGNITPICCALGNKRCSTKILAANDCIGGSIISNVGRDTLMMRLDDFGIDNIRLLKIDVEGHELEVLRGAYKTIKNSEPDIFVECNGAERFNLVNEYLSGLGYSYTGIRFNNTPTFLFKAIK